ncbi:NAD(P)-dependent oxidoreductase [Ornithinicoccus halotolerans]|uniref:NAD(P)-dependent oxidoreductase n=1 Tax=Ornithinicoccus halotolerans TaxID=1748220 RepID=UPI001E329A0A|nr:NAD(P)-dependent oxidoreductase [Ornithinicoccus halotolerans]
MTDHTAAATAAQPEERQRPRVAFLGLGRMGAPMAAHAQRAGLVVTGFNRSPGKAGPLLEAGGREVRSVPEAVADADLVAVMVSDAPDVRALLTGDAGEAGVPAEMLGDGVLGHARSGVVVVDFSSIAPEAAREHHALGAERGIGFVDAPVSGGELGAREARLSVMAGGEPEHVARARPLLEAVGRTVIPVGPPGAGQTVKCANQLVVAGHLGLLAEAIVFLRAHGVDEDAAVAVLGGGLAGSEVLRQKADHMLARSFEPGGRIALHHKDLGNALRAARDADVVTPLGAVAADLVASAVARGWGEEDHSVLYRVVEELAGGAPEEP